MEAETAIEGLFLVGTMHRFVFLVRFLTVGERARILPYPPVAKRASPVSCLRKSPPIDRRQGQLAD